MVKKWESKTRKRLLQKRVIYKPSYHHGRLALNLMADFWKTVQNTSLRIIYPKSQQAGGFRHSLCPIIG